MAKPGKYGDLSFKHDRLRWYKKLKNHNGNYAPVYFGPKAKSAQDRRAKKAALDAYTEHKEKLKADLKVEQFQEILQLVLAGALPIADLGDTPFTNGLIADYKRKGMVEAPEGPEGPKFISQGIVDPDARDPHDDDDWDGDAQEEATMWADDPAAARQELMDRQRRDRNRFHDRHRGSTDTKPGRKTIEQMLDAWLADERTNKPNLQESSHIDKKDGVATFRAYLTQAGTKYLGKKPEEVDDMLMAYRAWLISQLNDPASKIKSVWTMKDKTKFCAQFIRWARKQRYLKETPLRLDDFVAGLPTPKGGKPLPLAEIQKIWAEANARWRCLMLIGLNCGMKNSEVAGLRGKHLQGKRLMGIRAKTKKDRVLFNFVLWPSTLKAIKANRDNKGPDKLIFTNNTGGEITTQSFSASFKKFCKKAGAPTATFERLKDTSVKHVQREIHKTGLDRSYNSIFQMHKDAGTNAFYDDNTDPDQLLVPKLDKIVKAMEKVYGLKLDTSSPKAPAKKKSPSKTKAKNPKPPKPPRPELANLRNK